MKRLWHWLRNLFRRKPVYVTRRILDVYSGREVEVIVDRALIFPGMRISDIVNDMALGVKFNRPRKEILKLITDSIAANNGLTGIGKTEGEWE